MYLLWIIFLLAFSNLWDRIIADGDTSTEGTCNQLLQRQNRLEQVVRETLNILFHNQDDAFSEIRTQIEKNPLVNNFWRQTIIYDQSLLNQDEDPENAFSPQEHSVMKQVLTELTHTVKQQRENLEVVRRQIADININAVKLSDEAHSDQTTIQLSLNDMNQTSLHQQQRLDSLENQIRQISGSSLPTTINTLEILKKQMNYVNMTFSHLQNNVSELTFNLEQMDAVIKTIDETYDERVQNVQSSVLNQIASVRQVMEGKLKELESSSNSTVEAGIENCREEIQSLHSLLMKHASSQQVTKDKVIQLESTYSDLNHKLKAASEDCSKQIQNLHSQTASNQQQTEGKVVQLQSVYNGLNNQMEAARNECDEGIQNLHSFVVNQTSRVIQLEATCNEFNSHLEDMKNIIKIQIADALTNKKTQIETAIKSTSKQQFDEGQMTEVLGRLGMIENHFNQLPSFLVSLAKVGNESRIDHRLVLKETRVFSSPNYPANYPNNENKMWILTAFGNKTITLHFTHFDIEPKFDYLKVYDPFNTSSVSLTLAGRRDPFTIKSSGPIIFLAFATDGTYTRSGFQVKYSQK